MNRNNGIWTVVALVVLAVLYFFVIAPAMDWWPNNDGESRRDRLTTTIEDGDINKVDNILKDDDFDDDDIEAIEAALAELLTIAKANNVDEDEVNEELLEAIRDLDDDFDEKDLLEAIEGVVTKVVKTNGAGSSKDNERINTLETKLNEILTKLNSQPPSGPAPAGNPPKTGGQPTTGGSADTNWTPPKPGADLNNDSDFDKTHIGLAKVGRWVHRVFDTRLFNAANKWGGADSWFVSLNTGPNSGGAWTDHGKFSSGEIVYRGTENRIAWCLGVLTTSQYKSEFFDGEDTSIPAAINVRIAPNSVVTVKTASGKTVSQATSDAGDITIIMPDSGVITICVDYTTAAPTHESLVWWGPYDRSESINTIDAR